MNSIFGKHFYLSGSNREIFVSFTPESLEETKQSIKLYGEFSTKKYSRDSNKGWLWYDKQMRKAALISEKDLGVTQELGLTILAEQILDEHQRYQDIIDYIPPKQYNFRTLPFNVKRANRIKRINSFREYTSWWLEVASGEIVVEAAHIGTSTLVFPSLQIFMRLTGNGRFIGPRTAKSQYVQRYKHDRHTQLVHPEIRRLLGDLYLE